MNKNVNSYSYRKSKCQTFINKASNSSTIRCLLTWIDSLFTRNCWYF